VANWVQNKYARLAAISGILVAADQVTKALVLKLMPLHDSVSVIPGFFNLTHIRNPGGAFGFLANQSSEFRYLLFLFVASVAVILIFWFYKNTPSTYKLLSFSLAMIFGGAIGNLIDRIRFGNVVDFLDFYIGRYHYPAFNVADSAICVGVGIFLVLLLMGKLPQNI
jgi:signal peptidase II